MSAIEPPGSTAMEVIGAEQLASAGDWQIGESIVSFGTLVIRFDGKESRIAPKAMAVLLALARNPGETLSRDQLLDRVWPGDYPTQDVLSHAIRELRRALGDTMPNPVRIQTVPRIGYRLVATVSRLESGPNGSMAKPIAAAEAQGDTLPAKRASRADEAASSARYRWPAFFLLLAIAGVLAVAQAWNRWHGSASTGPRPDPEVRLLTSSLLAERMPAISDDGTRYAYVQFDEKLEKADLVVGSMASEEKRVVSVAEKQQNYAPQWSRSGSRLAFQSSTGSDCQISLLDMNGMDVTGRSYLDSCSGHVYDLFDWAVGDSGLWLSRPVGPEASATRIVLRDLDGADHPLDYQRQAEDYDRDPRQSPDGRWIAFRRGLHPEGALFVVARNGGEVRRLTGSIGYIGRFDWYPDSRNLLLSARTNGRLGLYRLDTTTRQLTDLGIADSDFIDIAQGAREAVFERVRLRYRIREYSLSGPGASQAWRVPSTGGESEAVYDPTAARIAFISDRSGSEQIWLTPGQRDQPRALTRFENARLLDLSFDAAGRELVWVLRNAAEGDQVCLLDTTVSAAEPACMKLAQREIRTPRRLAGARLLLYAALTADGWAAFVTDLDQPGQAPQRIGDRRRIEPNLQTDGDAVYLTDPSSGRIVRADPPYLETHEVLRSLPSWQVGRWRLAQGAAWYIWSDLEAGNFKLYRTSLTRDSAPQEVLDVGPDRAFPLLDISRDAARILVQTEVADETDIGMLGLPE